MFLVAYKRFLARRGPVHLILSDGGKNFIGARRKLDEVYKLIISSEFNREIIAELTPKKVEFRNSPPFGPHHGGIWESNIKSVKTHLFKVIGNQILTYEELSTVLIQIEAILNSRPLCTLSNDPGDLTALTPAHFLTLTPLDYIPAENLDKFEINKLQRHALIDKLVQSYWKRWHIEYLTTLHAREKWNTPARPIQVGDIVIIRESNIPVLC